MSKSYWIKILAGAFGIFALGMVVVNGVSHGKEYAHTVVASDASITVPLSLPLLSNAFRLEGRELGALKSLRIDRSAPESIESFHITVDLDDASALSAMATCDLSLDDFGDIDWNDTQFVCVSPLDMEDAEMIPFGTITFRPSGQVHVLNLPRELVEDLQNEMDGMSIEMDDAMAEVSEAMAEINQELAANKIQLKVNGTNVVDIRGGKGLGRMTIRDPATGKAIIQLRGSNESGGTLEINADAIEAMAASNGEAAAPTSARTTVKATAAAAAPATSGP